MKFKLPGNNTLYIYYTHRDMRTDTDSAFMSLCRLHTVDEWSSLQATYSANGIYCSDNMSLAILCPFVLIRVGGLTIA